MKSLGKKGEVVLTFTVWERGKGIRGQGKIVEGEKFRAPENVPLIRRD